MNTESFVLYESVYKQMEILEKRLNKETAYDFLKAVMEFGLYGVMPDDESPVWLYGFEQTITSISSAKDRRAATIANGKKGGRATKYDKDEIIELHESGMSNAKITEKIGCSLSTVERAVREYREKKGKVSDFSRQNLHNPSQAVISRHNLNVNVNVNENVNDNENDNGNEKINSASAAPRMVEGVRKAKSDPFDNISIFTPHMQHYYEDVN